MTVNYSDTAFSRVRLFVWDKLKEVGLLDPNDYIADGFIEPLVPIIPVQQVPEFNNLVGNKTYLIYDYDVKPYDEDSWWICEETIVFTVVSNDFNAIISITQFLVDLFRRMDDSATDVNTYNGSTSIFKFFNFILNSASSPSPFEEEGGRQMADIDISYKYSRVLDSNGRFI